MDKLMSDNRRQVDDFEFIDFADESKVTALRERLRVNAPLTVQWNDWEYFEGIQELRALYEKGKRNQWNATDDLDWDVPISKDEWIGAGEASLLVNLLKPRGADEATLKAALFDEVNYILSQLLHGEQAALQICGQLTNACPSTDEKYYAAQQTADEARHTEVIARFAGQKMGTIYPINPVVKVLLDELLQADTPTKKTLGMQTLFEGVAMGVLDGLGAAITHPLLKDLLQRVKLDESRHAAFGVLSMRRAVKDADEAQMHRLEDWAFQILEALNANQQLHMLKTFGPKYGLDPLECATYVTKMEGFHDFNSMMYMHTVMPNLVRLGLVTERTESRYRELGILSDVRLN